MRNTAILNFLKTFQAINMAILQTKISKVQELRMKDSPVLRTKPLIELIGMPVDDIAEASSCLWFVKNTVQ
jgi:hypothetical protein